MGNSSTDQRVDGTDPSLDEVHGVLSNPRYRYVVRYLHEHPTTRLDRLADVVAGAEAAATGGIATGTDRRDARISLHHAVLPKLDALGYVEYDPAEKTVARAAIPPAVNSLLGIGDARG